MAGVKNSTAVKNSLTGAGRHRHPVETGYARGEETRARIVSAALKMFGERGFEGASTRDIATAAGVNAPALQYYFDNKEGVYLACLEHIVGRLAEYMSGVTERAERALAQGADDEALIDAFCAIQARLAEFMFTLKDAADWRLFMARLQSGEGPLASFDAFENGGYKRRLSKVTSTIVGRLLGRAADDEETLLRTMTLSGQLTVFQCAPRSVLARLNWDAVDADRLALLKRVLGEQTAALLRSMVAARDAGMRGRTVGIRRRALRSNTRLARR
jgi:TetR/AcrR family transcriptional regulator, regulator of cefoperazone and chloramphenicol sensitivity